ncbi:hypothetical protein ACFL1H_08210 [Nanoarchaeota archaeon]
MKKVIIIGVVFVLLVIVGCGYTDVINPKKLVPDKCLVEPPIGVCYEYIMDSDKDYVKILLRNGGFAVDVQSITAQVGSTGCDSIPVVEGETGLNFRWYNEEIIEITWSGCDRLVAGEKGKFTFDIEFIEEGKTYAHIYSGEITSTIE